MPLFGPPNVEKLKQKGDVRGLIKALEYEKDKAVREAAARALGGLWASRRTPGIERSIDPLAAALADPAPRVRATAAKALAEIRDPRMLEPLARTMGDSVAEVRTAAATALTDLGNAQAVAALGTAVVHKDSRVRDTAVWALRRVGPSAALGALLPALRHPDVDVRATAAKALGEIGDVRAAEHLLAALHDDGVRSLAAEALRRLDDRRIVATLLTVVNAEKKETRVAAAGLLKHFGWQPNPEAADARLAAAGAAYWAIELEDQKRESRLSAAEALGSFNQSRGIQALVAALRDRDKQVRQTAARSLVRLYQQGKLTADDRRTILQHRSSITGQHLDGQAHADRIIAYRSSDCDLHEDMRKHDDSGIGVEFPV